MTYSIAARPTRSVLLNAVELAVRAPSVHNSQPWLWRVGEDSIDLFADPSRQLRIIDPGRRALLVSCGAALFQARLALSAAGWRSITTRLPDLYDPNRLANLLIAEPAAATETDLRLAAAALRRRTDRRAYATKPLGDDVLSALRDAAVAEGAYLHEVTRLDDRLVLAVAVGRADEAEAADPIYQGEFASQAAHSDVPGHTNAERATMLVLATDGPGPAEQLRAGEALGRVLLAATGIGLAVSPCTQPLDVPGPREMLRRVSGGRTQPQIVLRVGWPGPGAELPPTVRRPLGEVLDNSDR